MRLKTGKMENTTYSDRFYSKLQRCQVWQEQIGGDLVQYFNSKSVIDFGCGNGYYLNGAFKKGSKVFGLEYSYENCKKYIPKEIVNNISYADLSELIKTDKYDLAMSFEVAEHLPESKANIFVRNLIDASNSIVFSAAIPGQGGQDHINEQPQSYWIEKFRSNGYLYNERCVFDVREIFSSLSQKSKYINVVRRNVMFFKKELI